MGYMRVRVTAFLFMGFLLSALATGAEAGGPVQSRTFRICQFRRQEFAIFKQRLLIAEEPPPAIGKKRLALRGFSEGTEGTTVTATGSPAQIADFERALNEGGLGALYHPHIGELSIVLATPEELARDWGGANLRANRAIEAIKICLYMEMGLAKAAQEGRISYFTQGTEKGCVFTVLDYGNRLRALRYFFRDYTHLPGSQIRGRVLDEAGRPVRDALIKLMYQSSGDSEHTVHTDQNGSFTLNSVFELSPDSYNHKNDSASVTVLAEDSRAEHPALGQISLTIKADERVTRDIHLGRGEPNNK